MPLHTIPLCDFRYAGDVYSGVTFRYDTTGKIFKAGKPKLLREDTTNKIEKNNTKLLRSDSNMSIVKSDNKFLRRNNYDIGKYIFKFLEVENRCINISSSIFLKEFRNIILNINSSAELENTVDTTIDIEHSNTLERVNDYIEFSLEINKNLQELRNKQISKNTSLVYCNTENLLFNLVLNSIYVNKLSEKAIDKDKSVIFVIPNRIRFIDKSTERYFDRVYFIQSFLYENKYYERYDVKNINRDNYRFVDRVALKDVDYRNYVFNLKRDVLKPISKTYKLMRLKRSTIKRIMRDLQTKLLRKDNRRNLSNVINNYDLDRIAVNYVFRGVNRLLKRYIEKNIYFGHALGLNREIITRINKMSDVYLKDINFISIYGQVEKALLDVTTLNIFKNKGYSLGVFNRDLHKEGNHNKFIDIIKRWWWLDPTAPKDNLIIPNKDFSYTQELLNNPEYEYLRFTNHPIGWGANWGIDWNIPAYAVSIEIMLDLVNILIMIWHDNVQGWLCCTGKESMQFIMELLYDWYTLEISQPNADYYRAYRWPRWEAEKVYFLNLDNGLQAVGVLIANLIGYLKNHEFNSVPLWRNPKAMDIERNFNRMAENADLMKSLDKVKGKRYYYIETQNIEKKNILGDDINGSNS